MVKHLKYLILVVPLLAASSANAVQDEVEADCSSKLNNCYVNCQRNNNTSSCYTNCDVEFNKCLGLPGQQVGQ